MKYESSAKGERGASEVSRAVSYVARMRAAMSDTTYALPEASLRLPFDDILFEKSRALASKLAGPKLAYILVIGIGGSSMGTKAAYEASSGLLDGHTPFVPKMLFVDTCAPELLSSVVEIVLSEVSQKDELVIVVGSKSGATTETIMNASAILPALEAKFGSLADRVVCVTDEGSPLWRTAEEHGFYVLPIPKMVGGRFSVFSPVGVFPLLCAGVDVKAMLRGAQAVVHECVEGAAVSQAYRAAEDIMLWYEKGAHIFDLFLFHPELESFGKWYRQLFAESLGKNTTLLGLPFERHMVPTVSIGSVDLHSVEQMHLADPRFVARVLVRAHAPHWEHQFLAHDGTFAPLVPELLRRSPCEVLDAIYQAVKETYLARGISFGEIILDDLEPESLGALFQFQMCVVMHTANLLGINAFDQPNVEEYKNNVRRILGGAR